MRGVAFGGGGVILPPVQLAKGGAELVSRYDSKTAKILARHFSKMRRDMETFE